MEKTIKLKKSFKLETDTIKAYVSCSCPTIQCACRDIYDIRLVAATSQRQYPSSTQNYSSYLNK